MNLKSGEPTSTPISTNSVAIFAHSFEPPTLADRAIVESLIAHGFASIHICPVVPDPKMGLREYSAPRHRAAMLTLAFQGLESTQLYLDDVANAQPTNMASLIERWQGLGELWIVVSADQVRGGHAGQSEIQRRWMRGDALWREARFVVINDAGKRLADSDLPPHHHLVRWDHPIPTQSEIRSLVQRGESIHAFVNSEVEDYIERHRLFVPYTGQRHAYFQTRVPRLKIVYDPYNARSCELANHYAKFESAHPNMILVLGGDGTMLHAIREHWSSRLPFLGLNTGHHGFLLNETLPNDLSKLDLVSYNLPLLQVDAVASTGEPISELAFSDTWIERAEGQAAWLQVDVDGETRVSKVVGDGMLIATAAGSSSYARAMGAIPVPLNTPVLTLVGSNIFQPRFWKPMALLDASVITLSSLDDSGKRPLRGFVDGQPIGLINAMTVRQSQTASVELAFTTEFDPSARLLRSLFPNDEASQ